jgi:hypothetical protein
MFYYSLTNKKILSKPPISWDETPYDIDAKTIYSAISPGTEMAAYLEYEPLRPSQLYPRLMGYCNLAQDLISHDFILTFQSHRSHFRCSNNDVLLRFNTLSEKQQKHAATIYLYHLGYDALIKAIKHKKDAKSIAIIGCGTLGLACALVAKAMGFTPTIFSNQKINPTIEGINIEPKSNISENENQYDWVINTSNQWDDHHLSMQLASRFSPIVMIGFPGRGQDIPSFNPLTSKYIYDKQLALFSCGDIPLDEIKNNIKWIWDKLSDNTIDGDILISNIFPSSNLDDAYQQLKNRKPNTFTYLLDWTQDV